MFCEQLSTERKKADDTASVSATKKKKRKRDKVTSDKSDVVSSAKDDAASDSVNTEAKFVPHDYSKANLASLLQGTFCHSALVLLWRKVLENFL